MPDHYTDGEYQLTLDADNPSEELNGAYRGTVKINLNNPATITSNGTITAPSGTVWSSVTVNVQVPEWDGKGITYS
jgi:hemolysin activation/secretion protein